VKIDERNEMAAPYTPRQGQFLAYIHAYIRLHRHAPTEMEMANYFGVSPPSVHQMVVALQNRGLIQRLPGQARSIRVLVSPRDLPDLESGQTPLRVGPAFEECYPDLAGWIMGGGWVELGKTDCVSSMARALDAGGMVWEGKERYRNMDDLLRELNEGIARWNEEDA
jgi:SOS-response transcriptional repressor LexA